MAALGEELLTVVNKLQDLVFNTIGNDSLDLPQIVCIERVKQRKEASF
jgi:dynamin 1-like protein